MAGPKRSIIEALLLIYRPPLLDILPMYIIFLMFTSGALLLARKIGWMPILWTGLSLWALAQFGLRADAYKVAAKVIPAHIPLNEMGAFDLWAWQFLWIAGVWLGVRWAQNNLPIEKWAKRLLIPSVLIAAACFVLRRAIEHGLHLGPAEFLFDKWHLGPFRLVDFAAVAMLLIVSQLLWKFLAVGPLVLMGQSSLQVFCVHLLCCFAGLTLLGNASMLSGWKQIALLTGTFAAMLVTAKVFSKSEAKHERKPKPESAGSTGTQVAPTSYAPQGRERKEAEHPS
jgi:hypothetical protein